MKKTLIALQILLLIALVFKLISAGHLFGILDFRQVAAIGSALAGLPPPISPSSALKDVDEDEFKKERDLYSVLEKKRADLDIRENALKEEEKKLVALRKEIQDKIDAFLLIEKRVEAKLETEREEDIKRYKSLAKILENTLPAKAGAVLEKLDNKTAAGIAMTMKKDKVGPILSHVSVQKAVDITREITKSSSNPREKDTK